MDIATIRPMGLGPKFSWPFISFFLSLISYSLLFTLFTVMRFYCSVYKHNWSEVGIWGMDDYVDLYLF